MIPTSSDINLRNEFKKLQDEYSLDILYIRASKHIRCRCFNPLHKTGTPGCPICLGYGHVNTIEKRKAITHSLNATRASDGLIVSDLGSIGSDSVVFYLDHKFYPRKRDLIALTYWDKNKKPVGVKKVYEITLSDELRGEHGRIELNAVYCKLKPEITESVEDVIAGLSDKARMRIANGERYIWQFQN